LGYEKQQKIKIEKDKSSIRKYRSEILTLTLKEKKEERMEGRGPIQVSSTPSPSSSCGRALPSRERDRAEPGVVGHKVPPQRLGLKAPS
jgi:hypothetical protein